jgi:hypothetical protein
VIGAVKANGMETIRAEKFKGVPNPRYRVAWRFFGLAMFLFAALVVMIGGGFANPAWIALLCGLGFGGVISLGVAVIYWGKGWGIAAMLRGEGVWATWKLSPEQWTRFVEDKFQRERRSGWGSGRDIVLFAAGLWVMCWLQEVGTSLVSGAVILPLALVGGGVARWVPFFLRRRRLACGGSVVVGRQAVFMGGEIFQWDDEFRRLQVAELVSSGGDNLLRLVVIKPHQEGKPIEYEFMVPVPPEKLGVAKEVSVRLKGVQEEVRKEVEKREKRFVPLVIFSVVLGIILIVGGVFCVLWMERAERLREDAQVAPR